MFNEKVFKDAIFSLPFGSSFGWFGQMPVSGSWIGSMLPAVLELPAVEEDDFDEDVPVETPAIEWDGFELVGHGKVTNEHCGKFRSFYGCLRVDLHNKIAMVKVYDREEKRDKVVSTLGKVYVRRVVHSCGKPSCPVCYKYGWAGRQARKAELRLVELSKRWGQVNHIVVTFPKKFWHLKSDTLKKKAREVLRVRRVIGGFVIFHCFRYNTKKFWHHSPHFHVMGFIRGGYKCRRCKKIEKTGKCGIENRGCDGFVNRNYRAYEKDGCIVLVKGKRKTIRGTIRYLLDHSCIKKGVKRPHSGVWFGVASYRKAKIKVENKGCECLICKHSLVKLRYFGFDDPDFKYDTLTKFRGKDGLPLWAEEEDKKGWG